MAKYFKTEEGYKSIQDEIDSHNDNSKWLFRLNAAGLTLEDIYLHPDDLLDRIKINQSGNNDIMETDRSNIQLEVICEDEADRYLHSYFTSNPDKSRGNTLIFKIVDVSVNSNQVSTYYLAFRCNEHSVYSANLLKA